MRSNRCELLLLVLLLVGGAHPCDAVRFLLKDTHPICFVEEVDETTKFVTGEYTRATQPADVTATLSISGPNGVQVSSSQLLVGTHAFSAPVPVNTVGGYTLCLRVEQHGWGMAANTAGILMDFSTDRVATAVQEKNGPVAKREKVGDMEVFTFREFGGEPKDSLQTPEYIQRVESALSAVSLYVSDTKGNMEYLLAHFARMRYTSESTFTRIWAFGVTTAVVMVTVTWLQFRFLKSTLRHKKLV